MASILLSKLDFLRLVEHEKEDMNPNRGIKIVDKVVENLTWGR